MPVGSREPRPPPLVQCDCGAPAWRDGRATISRCDSPACGDSPGCPWFVGGMHVEYVCSSGLHIWIFHVPRDQ